MVHVIIDEIFKIFGGLDTVDNGCGIFYPGERNYISVDGVFVVEETLVAGVDVADEETEGEEVAVVHCLPGVSYDCAATY